jgi:5'-nucleotidase
MRAALILFVCAGCVQFNGVCAPDTSELVGATQRSLDVRAVTVQTQEAVVGDLVADAFRDATGADLALVPAQSFAQNTVCGPRDFIDRGPLRLGDVTGLLPEADTVVVMSITSDELDRLLEHSVAPLRSDGQVVESPGFLQVSGIFFSVDCSQEGQTLSGGAIDFPGQRVDPASISVGDLPIQPGERFQLATTTTLAGGALGYVDLDPSKIVLDTGKMPSSVLADYLRAHSPVNPQVEGRILLEDTCK